MKKFFTPQDVREVVGISYRQLQYWDKTNFIKPSAATPRNYRRYGLREMIEMWLAKALREIPGHKRDWGTGHLRQLLSIQRLRKIISDVRDLFGKMNCSLGEIKIMVDPKKGTVFVYNGECVTDPDTSQRFVTFKVSTLIQKIKGSCPRDPEERKAAA